MWANGHMTNPNRFANAPNRTAAHLSKNETPSVWHYTTQTKMELPLSQGQMDYALQPNESSPCPTQFPISLDPASTFFLSDFFKAKPCMHFSLLIGMLHTLPIRYP
jgi:hypothetical protein